MTPNENIKEEWEFVSTLLETSRKAILRLEPIEESLKYLAEIEKEVRDSYNAAYFSAKELISNNERDYNARMNLASSLGVSLNKLIDNINVNAIPRRHAFCSFFIEFSNFLSGVNLSK